MEKPWFLVHRLLRRTKADFQSYENLDYLKLSLEEHGHF